MDQSTLDLLNSIGDYIKVIGVIGGGIFAGYSTFKTLFVKQFQEGLTAISKTLDKIQEENVQQNQNIEMLLAQQDSTVATNRDVLRSLITAKYYQYKDKGFFPMYERECITLIYADYKALHGNSFIDSLYKELMDLPYSHSLN